VTTRAPLRSLGFAFLTILAAAALISPGISAPPPAVQWIWFDEGDPLAGAPSEPRYFRKRIELPKGIADARVSITADNGFTLFVNGDKVGSGDNWMSLASFDVKKHLRAGRNVLAVEGRNDGGPAGLMVRLRYTVEGKTEKLDIVSDSSWKANKESPKGWTAPDFDDAKWPAACALGEVGKVGPWGNPITGGGVASKPPKERFTVPAGFRVVEVVKIPEADPRFSLVNMCFDAKGRLLVSREGEGIFLCTKPDKDGILQEVKLYCSQVKNCHGMCWVRDHLYLVGNGPKGTGLYRCTPAKDEDKIAEATQIFAFQGGMGEHGPHGVIHGPDNMLYVVIGNHSWAKVDKLADNSPLRRWPTGAMGPDQNKPNTTEDVLLPRLNDARGHAANILAPGGTIWRMDTEGKNVSLFSAGYRNQFDAAFSPDGELFTFDSDMEWDEGLPWYRAVRISHCPAGSDFLWRTGAANTPNYYLDSLPPLHETGRGSPVGVEVYDHTYYPKRYSGAVLVADWSLGRIYSTHVNRSKGTYSAEVEIFCSGNPMNVTDLAVAPDGCVYFTTGGRGTQGGVFRIEYGDKPSTDARKQGAVQPLSAWGRAALAVKPREAVTKDTASAATLSLAQIQGTPPSPDVLIHAANVDAFETRAAALYLLGVNGYKEGEKTLVAALKDKDAFVRRRACEALIRAGFEPPVESIWPLFGEDDRFVRTAARLVLQRIDTKKWTDKLWAEKNNDIAFEGIVALCKTNQAAPHAKAIFDRLAPIYAGKPLPATVDATADVLKYVRTIQLALIHTKDRPDSVKEIAKGCVAAFPHRDPFVNRELAIVMAHSRTAGLVDEPVHGKLLSALLAASKDRQQQIHYFYCLRVLGKDPWTPEQKESLLKWFEETKAWTGGFSFTPFLENILTGLQPAFTVEDRAQALQRGEQIPWAALALARGAPAAEQPGPALLAELYVKVSAAKNPVRGNEMKEMIVEALGKNAKSEAEAALRTIADKDPSRILAVAQALQKTPSVDNWPYLVRGVEKANPPTLNNLIDVLKKSPVKPKAEDPVPYRALLTAAGRLNEKERWKAVELLRHWGNGKQFGGDKGEWKIELDAWTRWYGQTFPKEPALVAITAGGEGKYKFKDLLTYLESPQGKKGDVTKGRAVFEKAQCLKCHKYGKEGEGIGPDLTTLSKRFKRSDVLESVLFPSKVISDQYRSVMIVTKKGQTINGLAVPQGDTITVLQSDGSKVTLQKGEIEQQFASLISVMPEKLFDTLTQEEIADLFAFLESEPK
jgi:putative heme-binding domain-containing protein